MTYAEDSSPKQIQVRCDAETFLCKKDALRKASPYFGAMFSGNFAESMSESVEIKGVDATSMGMLIEYVSKGRLDTTNLDLDGLISLAQAASMLQFESAAKICVRGFLRLLSPESCLGLMEIGEDLGLMELKRKARSFFLHRFSTARRSSTFLSLTMEEVMSLLSSDGLNPTTEEEVFDSIVEWIEEDQGARKVQLLQLLTCIRYYSMDPKIIASVILQHPLIRENHEATVLLYQILKHLFAQLTKEYGPKNPALDSPEADLVFGESSSSALSSSPSPQNGITERLIEDMCPERLVRNNPRYSCEALCVLATIRKGPLEADLQGANRWKSSSACFRYMYSPYDVVALRLDFHGGPETEGELGLELVPFLRMKHQVQGFDGQELLGYEVCALGDKVMVFGGELNIGRSNWNVTVSAFDVITEEWRYDTSLPKPRRHHRVVADGEDVYLIGGYGKHRMPLSEIHKYNSKEGTWSVCSKDLLLVIPNQFVACMFQGRLHVITPSDCLSFKPLVNDDDEENWCDEQRSVFPATDPPTLRCSFADAHPYKNWIILTESLGRRVFLYDPVHNAGPFLCATSQNEIRSSLIHLERDGLYLFTQSREQPNSSLESVADDEVMQLFVEVVRLSELKPDKKQMVEANVLWESCKAREVLKRMGEDPSGKIPSRFAGGRSFKVLRY